MRILILNKHRSETLGGSEIQCDLIARGLVARGHEVHYGAFDGITKTYALPYPCRAVPAGDQKALNHLLRQIDPQLVYWRFNFRHFRRSAKTISRHGAKLVFSVSHERDVYPLPPAVRLQGLRSSLRHRIDYFGYRYVDGLVSLNKELLMLAPVSNQIYIPNMMKREAHPFYWPSPYIVWVAQIKARKQPERYVELATKLHNQGINLDCLMVGKIQDNAYRFLIEGKSLPPNFHYLGEKDPLEVNGILQKSLFLVHTCEPEGFGNIFIQSWFQSRPTLSLNYDPEGVIEREGLGRMCGTMDRLFKETLDLMEDESRRKAIGNRAREYAIANHSPEDNIVRFESFFEQIIHS